MVVLFIAASLQTHAQGTVYDQQSATGPVAVVGNGNADGLYIQEDQPLVQSFIPSLSSIGFVQFEFEDVPNNGNNGATVYVKLWTGSPNVNLLSATLLGSTAPVYMPNGFVNNGLGVAGIANFSFSTPVTLTAGQTYYIQPVVLSGDDPWAIVTIGNTYLNGQVFEAGGGFNTDFWFREGLVSVPEPTALALIGLGSLLVFGFKRRPTLFVALLFAVSILSVHAASDSVVQATADEAGLARVSGATISHDGTFWVMTVNTDGSLNELPYPFLPSNLSTLPIFSVSGDKFIVDDTSGQLSPSFSSSSARMSTTQAAATVQSQAQSMAGLIDLMETNNDNQSFQPNGFTPMIDTNGHWLEASNEVTSLGLRLHNTIVGDNSNCYPPPTWKAAGSWGKFYLPLADLRALAMIFSRSMSKAKVIRNKVSNVGIRCSCSIKAIV